MSNLSLDNTKPVCGSLPYIIKEMSGMKVGIMGLVDS